MASKFHWIRALIGGFLAEACLIGMVIPVGIKFGQRPLLYLAPAGSLVTCFVFAIWVGRRVESRFVLHGTLVGLVAALIYVALTKVQPEPWPYIVAHVLKVLGGGAGGLIAAQQRQTAATPQSET